MQKSHTLIFVGKHSFNHKSLHFTGNTPNPYEQAISIIGRTLSSFDEDNLIPCFGFGDGEKLFLIYFSKKCYLFSLLLISFIYFCSIYTWSECVQLLSWWVLLSWFWASTCTLPRDSATLKIGRFNIIILAG